VRVSVNPNIEGVVPAAQLPLLETELSNALASAISSGGKWAEFCWNLSPNAVMTDAELRVFLDLTEEQDWAIRASFTARVDNITITEDLPREMVRSNGELQSKGPLGPALLQAAMGTWFSEKYLNSPQRDQLHTYFRKNVRAGGCAVAALQVGPEQLCALYLPNGLQHFKYSVFKFVCKQNGLPVSFQVQGAGIVEFREGFLVLGMRPASLPAGLQQGTVGTAYLVKYRRESELGDLIEF
jgi:hypothetical protein